MLEFIKVAGPPPDPREAFHVVIPSLPGYGLSGKPSETGWNVQRIARAWIVLMARLGDDRFVGQGGDWGLVVTSALGGSGDPAVTAIYLNMVALRPTPEQVAEATPRRAGGARPDEAA